MRAEFLPFAPPAIGDEEIAEVTDALRSGWITTGPKVARFEGEFAAAVAAPSALAVSSGTAALHTALLTLGVQPGQTVITSPLTFVSALHVIEHAGARPVLADVEPETLNLDPERVAEVASSAGGVAGLMPVHLYGQPCDLDPLIEIASELGASLIEDAAHALPATYKGRSIGAVADPSGRVPSLTAFSFYATKNITTAEGGMLTGPEDLVAEARTWSVHGMTRGANDRYAAGGSWHYDVTRAGFKYNMSDVHAAIGLAQLNKLDTFADRRREVARRYTSAFSQVESLEPPVEVPGRRHAWHVYALRLRLDQLRIDRDQFIEELRTRNVGTSVHFIPIHLLSYYRDRYGWRPQDFPVATREWVRLLSLPLHPRLSDQDIDDVVSAVTDIAATNAR